jgi:cupin superfamily acireductone dioxygenase involved in methionine salvage
MAEMTAKRRRYGRETAEKIASMAAESQDPFIKKELYRAVNAIRKHFAYTEAEKEQEVLRRITIGASTVNDLIRETGFAQQDIMNITKKLEDSHLIELQRLRLADKAGRPTCLFFPTNGHI